MTPKEGPEPGTPTGPDRRPVSLLTRARLLQGVLNELPGSERGGYMRSAFPGPIAGTFRTNMIAMPMGQKSPPRESDIEHIIVVLEGGFLFTIDGAEYHVEYLDQLFVPVGVTWEYQNAVLGQSVFLAIVGP